MKKCIDKFVSLEKDTREEAFAILEEVRNNHPASEGWEYDENYIERLRNGKWRAVSVYKKTFFK